MKLINTILIVHVIIMCTHAIARAQEVQTLTIPAPSYTIEAVVGGKVGGVTPLGLPASIRSFDGFAPAVPFFVGAFVSKHIKSNIALRTGLIMEGKGMTTDATVKGYKTTFSSNGPDNQEVMGYYYGTITTQVKNIYATVPLQVQYNMGNWKLHAGAYVGILLSSKFSGKAVAGYIRSEAPTGEKLGLSNAPYDFSDAIRRIDIGGQLGAQYALGSQLGVFIQGEIGATNVLKPSFETVSFPMNNIFLSLGISYKLK